MTPRQNVESKFFNLFYEHSGVGIDLANSLSKEAAKAFDIAVRLAVHAIDHDAAVKGLCGEQRAVVESMASHIRITRNFQE